MKMSEPYEQYSSQFKLTVSEEKRNSSNFWFEKIKSKSFIDPNFFDIDDVITHS